MNEKGCGEIRAPYLLEVIFLFVVPNTDIRILSGVPLNNDYEHTIYFETIGEQSFYFIGKTKINLSNQSYQRKERGWLKVEVPQNNLWDCSYLMYRNTSYGNKWFYAFILSVEYINDNNSLINYEIDVMQTWMFDYQLEPCFVEREHTLTDNLFENTIAEDLDIGENYNIQIQNFKNLSPTNICLVVSAYSNNAPITPTIQGNIISGLKYITFDETYYNTAISVLNAYIAAGFQDDIVAAFQYPPFLGGGNPGDDTVLPDYTEEAYSINPNLVNVDGYVPKNKKLFTYPYNYIEITDNMGVKQKLKLELWDTNHVGEFNIRGCLFGKPTILVYPRYYRDIAHDYESGISFSKFPQIPWVGDAYQVWLAQNRDNLIINTATGMMQSLIMRAVGAATGSPILAMSSALGFVTEPNEVIGKLLSAKNIPNTPEGTPNVEVLTTQTNTLGIRFNQYTIRNEFARIIDEYFSRFGYACHRIKIPNRNARENWTYTKTVGCEILSQMPVDDAVKIKKIYDRGITFWNNPANVGNYGDFTNPVYST